MNSAKNMSENQVAVVTGSAGIGLAVAQRLLTDGFEVVLCGYNAEDNAKARETINSELLEVVLLDVSDSEAVKKFAAGIGIDKIAALVNCAGIQPYGTIETTSPDQWNQVINVNLTGYFNMVHFLYPLLKANEGAAVVNLASVQGHQNQTNVLAYATSKGAIHAFTRALAVDCIHDKVRVNSISPGSVHTPLLEFAARSMASEGETMEETLAGFGAANAIGRVGKVEEIAAMVSYLVGEESGFCVGSDFVIDGGLKIKLGL